MLETAVQILSQYVREPVARTTFTHLEIIRLDVEDFLYLCEVGNQWFAVYESDYIDDLPRIAKEASNIFGDDFKLLHWLPKIDSKDEPTPLNVHNSEPVYALPDSYLRYAVIELEPKFKPETQPDLLSYGGSRL